MALSTKQLRRSLNRILSMRFRWVSFSVITIIVLLGYYFFLNPKLSEIRRVGVFDLARTKEQLELKRDIYQTTKELHDRYNQLNLENVELLAGLLPDRQQLPELFVQVEALALASNLRLDNVGFAEVGTTSAATRAAAPATGEGGAAAAKTPPAPQAAAVRSRQTLKKLSVTFSVSGGNGYSDLKKFLANVESSLRLLDVQSLSYTPGEDERYQINAITYYLQQ